MGDAMITRRRRRPLESYNQTWIGLVAFVIVVIFVGASLLWKQLGIGYTHYTGEFTQAAALHSGDIVTVAGIEVGRIAGMKLNGDHVEAGLTVRNDVALGRDTTANIKVMTILGSRYLELVPGGAGLLPTKTIDLDHTTAPYDLQTALQDATTTYEQVDSDQFAQSLTVLGNQLGGLPPLVPQAMTNLHTMSSVVADRRNQLGALLASTQRVANTLRRQQTDLGNLIDQGQDLIGQLVARQATFHAMLAALNNLVNNLDEIVVDDRATLDETFKNLRDLTDMIGEHDDLLRSLLQAAPIPLRGITNATAYGPDFELHIANGLVVDSWMCAISGRAKQFGMIEYFKDCK